MSRPAKAKKFQDLDVWKKAHELVLSVYSVTRSFPNDERFGLVSQMRRAAISIAANIAEGFKKRSLKDKSHFYNIAQASLEEVRYYIILAVDLNYLAVSRELSNLAEDVAKMLYRLIKSIDS